MMYIFFYMQVRLKIEYLKDARKNPKSHVKKLLYIRKYFVFFFRLYMKKSGIVNKLVEL